MNPKNESSLVHHFLENSAEAHPEKVALIHEEVRATYSDINSRANCLAHYLLEQGVAIGDRVVFIFENCLEYAVCYYGIFKAGAVAVPLSSGLKPQSLEPLLAELEPAAIISSARFERLLKQVNPQLIQNSKLIIQNLNLDWSGYKGEMTKWESVLQDGGTADPGIEIRASHLASIIYTSGSTGRPKGVMLSHRNIVANTQSICQYLNLTEKDIQMVVLPFFYVMGKSLLNTHFAVGGTVVINNQFAYPAAVLNQMIEEEVTGFSGVPSTYAYLLHRSPLEKCKNKLNSLRYCSQAGGHMANTVKQKLRQVLPEHTQIYIMYGATEASARLTYLKPGRFEDKMGSIGEPIPGVILRIMDQKGRELPAGEKGELVASGPNIMQGYWEDAEATARVLDKQGYHTGDTGYQDKDGFFYVEGRKDNLVKVGGHRINPQEIEDALLSTDLIVEAAVIGLPDDLLGHKLSALIVPQNGDCTAKKVLALCSQKLPKFKMPTDVKMVHSIPKNANGKTDRAKCIELVSGGHAGKFLNRTKSIVS
jgi:long-chain acyl-CoA synthetase